MSPETTTRIKYLRNPDVVLREEDEDGGLLFNPDTNQIKVINATALFIWQQLEVGREAETIMQSIQDAFDEVPADVLANDMQQFIDEMVRTGFIGTVVSA